MTTAWDLLAQNRLTDQTVEDALGVLHTIVEYAGTIAFAISAALVGGQRRMTFVGVVVFGTIVAVSGGTMRDILMGILPVYWVAEPTPLFVAAVAAGATIPLFKTGALSVLQRYDLVQVSDAAGLALFTILGTNVALDAGAGTVSAVVVGSISGLGGGIVRDTIAERVPEVLSSVHLYATTVVAGSLLNIALLETRLLETVASAIAVAFILSVRLLAIHYDWGLPRFRVPEGEDDPRSGL